ncbi:MAG: hypothetical protein GX862_04400, partial [Leucobacter sp.]|nr:hypothetical protein [Leucobacter sp.]
MIPAPTATAGFRSPRKRATGNQRRFTLLISIGLAALSGGIILGLAVGSHPVEPAVVLDAVFTFDPTNNDHVIVIQSRL